MSSYTTKFRHRDTGIEYLVQCRDDYFGRHRYGYIVEDCEMYEGKVLNEDEFEKRFEWIKTDES